MSVLLNFYLICFGRFVLGFSCGVLLCATPKALDEVIPNSLIAKFGTSTNIMINIAFLALMITANYNPDSRQELQTSNFWMFLFTMQAPF